MKTCIPSVRGQGLLLVTALSVSLALRAFSSNLLVYNNNDSGAGSLRQAIATAHLVPGPNTIVFSNVVTGFIGLTGGEILIHSNMTILGPGPGVVTVGGNGSSRLFEI